MKIAISLNEVLRDFIGQLTYTYGKYIQPTDIKEGDVTSLDLIKFFPFKTKLEMNKFIYSECALEIFGHADQAEPNLFTHLNHLVMDLTDDGEHELELVANEADSSIPSTLFFLSKNLCKVKNIRFVQDEINMWDGVDILITANPYALECKPQGKVGVKVDASYNADVIADYEIPSLKNFISDLKLRENIINNNQLKLQEND